MSAFMVQDKTINRIVYWFSQYVKGNSLATEWAKKAGVDTSLPDWENTLGRKMFNLNMLAVNYRYGIGTETRRDYRYRPVPASRVQVLKSLQCWLYQCMEGQVPKKPLYRFFKQEVSPLLSEMIAEDSAEYRDAEWD